MAGAVAQEVSAERLQRLQDLQDRHTRERLGAFANKETVVLVEGRSTRDPSRLSGRTPCYKTVSFTPTPGASGPFRRIVVRAAGPHSLSGEEGVVHG